MGVLARLMFVTEFLIDWGGRWSIFKMLHQVYCGTYIRLLVRGGGGGCVKLCVSQRG